MSNWWRATLREFSTRFECIFPSSQLVSSVIFTSSPLVSSVFFQNYVDDCSEEIQEVYRDVENVEYVEKIVEVPQIQYVEKIVEIPDVQVLEVQYDRKFL